ncbi:MAG TPA: RND family transporter, partial [Flavobacteriia bacterium]|nr:RND family transporter [Flavobacteriia bacterium]
MSFWTIVARGILRGKYVILAILIAITYFLALQIKNVKFSNSEANLLPSDHLANIEYNKFLKIFGEEGNLIILAVKDTTIFEPKKFNNWNKLMQQLSQFDEVEAAKSIGDIKVIVKDTKDKKFITKDLFDDKSKSKDEILAIKANLFKNLPFYKNLLFNEETGTIRGVVYLKKDIVNTKKRITFVLNKLIPEIKKFEEENNVNVYVSGMPYVRTLNAKSIKDEMKYFVFGALFITALIFFFFFRSYRATLITVLTVVIGVIWSFGTIGLLGYKITILTALIPPLIIIIGVPNAIFLIHKYQQEIKNHGNQAKSLIRVISKIGNATLMTNLTTAAGFATFIFTKSKTLNEFGIVASINIFGIF